jgi:hypothetical protein
VTALFTAGDRVVWSRTTKTGVKRYPATVENVGWYRRTAEPWQYMVRLDRNAATARMSHLLRFPPESQLSPEEEACA